MPPAHKPDNRRAFAADLDFTLAVLARIAVDVACGERGNHAVVRERMRLVITKALARPDRMQLRNARLDRQRELALLRMRIAARI